MEKGAEGVEILKMYRENKYRKFKGCRECGGCVDGKNVV